MATPPTPVRLTEDWPPVTGRPAVAQGVYGDHGNLEMVACAADYGLLVGWFNADTVDTYAGALVGAWSGALRFGGTRRYVSATITQVSHGPDFLEVLAATEAGELHRHVWSPDHGFVDHGVIAAGIRAHSGIVELPDGTLVTAVADAAGGHLLRATPGVGYPSVDIVRGPFDVDGPLADLDIATHDEHLDILATHPDGRTILTCAGTDMLVAEGVSAARLTCHGTHRAILLLAPGRARLLELGDESTLDLGPAADGALTHSVIDGGPRWEQSAYGPGLR